MNIVILGAGNIGSYLALVLSQEGHNVVVIDRDDKALERLSRSADIATRVGSGTDWKLLEEVRDISPDFFIAMSSNDETNLTACSIAKSLGYPKTIARIRQNAFLDNSHINFNRLFSVDYILGTELVVAMDIFKFIINPGNLAVENFAHGAVQMRTIVMPQDFSDRGKPLADVSWMNNLLVGVIRRKNENLKESIILPKGQDMLLPGDEATIFGKTSSMRDLPEIFGMPKKGIHSAVLIGGSGVAIHLAHLLEEQKIKIKIIEQDEQRCALLARLIPSAVILNHDGTDLNFLKEERVCSADVLVACTSSHETNILAAILGRQAGCQEVIALVSEESVVPLLQKFQISYSLSEKASITRRIHLIMHDKTVVSLASLYENQAKILEVKIAQDSSLINIPLSELSSYLPKNMLIAMIKNRNGIIIPKGSSLLSPGDTAIVVCCAESEQRLRKML